MIGVGRMGGNMARRRAGDGHTVVAHDRDAAAMRELAEASVRADDDLAGLVAKLAVPRTVWLMVPAAVAGEILDALVPLLSAGDTVVDGGNSQYRDAIRRARWLSEREIAFVDVGVSGGIRGGERGRRDHHGRVPALRPGRCRSFRQDGPQGIDYGQMAAHAEGVELLRHANAGSREQRRQDALSMVDPPPADALVYLRGNPRMIDVAADWLAAAGFASRSVIREKYQSRPARG